LCNRALFDTGLINSLKIAIRKGVKNPFFMLSIFIIVIVITAIAIGTFHFIFDNYVTYSHNQHFPYLARDHNEKDNLKIELVSKGLSLPTSMAFIDKHNILVLEKNSGAVRLISDGILKKTPVLKLNVDGRGERGLLGIAVMNNTLEVRLDAETKYVQPSLFSSPLYPAAYVFLYLTELEKKGESKNVIYRYDWTKNSSPLSYSLTNPKLILEFPSLAGLYHDGGKMIIGPRDHQLYATIGDMNAPNSITQNYKDGKRNGYSSVILRMDPITGLPSAHNPFLNNASGRDGIIGNNNNNRSNRIISLDYCYAYGIRNSFGLAFDPVTGFLWDTENGEDKYDEINLVKPGFNSGWDKIMGPLSRNNNTATSESELFRINGSYYSDPKFSWRTPIGITAIEFLSSSVLGKKYENNIFVGDINRGNIYYFELKDSRSNDSNNNRTDLNLENTDNDNHHEDSGLKDLVADNKKEAAKVLFAANFEGRITDIKTGPDGYLYILTYFDGKVYKIASVL
jgi:glucose/arabinose dehydrogenase